MGSGASGRSAVSRDDQLRQNAFTSLVFNGMTRADLDKPLALKVICYLIDSFLRPYALRKRPFLSKICQNHNMIILYGIPNCDTVKKARVWLAEHGQAYAFHDFKKQGVPQQQLALWTQTVGWDKLLNRKGTSWRKLDEAAQAAVVDAGSAQALMLGNSSVIKRPVVDWGKEVTVGFDAVAWAERI